MSLCEILHDAFLVVPKNNDFSFFKCFLSTLIKSLGSLYSSYLQ